MERQAGQDTGGGRRTSSTSARPRDATATAVAVHEGVGDDRGREHLVETKPRAEPLYDPALRLPLMLALPPLVLRLLVAAEARQRRQERAVRREPVAPERDVALAGE